MEQNRNSRWPRNLFLAVTMLLELLFSMADTAPSLLQEGTKASETCSFSFTDLNGTLASPNYPGDYPNNVFCSWEIDVTDVDEGSTITLVFEEFHLENSQGCEKDYVEVYDGANYHLFCGREIPPVIVSIGSVMSVALVTDEDIHVGHKFLAHYSTSPALNTTTTPWNISSTTDANWPTTDPNDNCGEVLELDNSYVWRIFYSPQHEGPYPSLINCTWTFINNLHEQYETRVVFLRLDLDTDGEEDFVGFWNGTDELRRFSGNYHHTGIYNDTIATPALRNEGWETTVTFHAEPPSSWNATGFLFAVTRALSEDPTTASNKNHRTSNDDAGEIIDGAASLTKIGPAKPSDNLHERFQRNKRNATMVVDINMVTGKITSSGRHGRALACFGDCSEKVTLVEPPIRFMGTRASVNRTP